MTSLGGGSGSGHAAKLVEYLNDTIDIPIILFAILPSIENSLFKENVFESYNTVLSLNIFKEEVDSIIVVDNNNLSNLIETQNNNI